MNQEERDQRTVEALAQVSVVILLLAVMGAVAWLVIGGM